MCERRGLFLFFAALMVVFLEIKAGHATSWTSSRDGGRWAAVERGRCPTFTRSDGCEFLLPAIYFGLSMAPFAKTFWMRV